MITKFIIPLNKDIVNLYQDPSHTESAKTNIADALVKYTTTTPTGKYTFLKKAMKLYFDIHT